MCPSRPSFARTLATASLAVAISSTNVLAAENNDADPSITPLVAQQARQLAQDHTRTLIALQKRWEKAQGAEKSLVQNQMVAKAEERHAYLLELIKVSPAEVLEVAIPNEKQMGIPAEVASFLEQKLDVEGELEIVYIDDFESPENSRVEHALKTPFGERFLLHRIGNPSQEARNGQQVRLQGILIGTGEGELPDANGAIAFYSENEEILTLGADNSASYGSEPGVQANTIGEQKTLVLMVNFSDAPSEAPWSKSDMQSMMDSQVNNFYDEVSYSQTYFNTTVFGWSTIDLAKTTCDRVTLTNQADQAAANAGYNINDYDRLLYAFPRNACNWGGLGTVGGQPSRAWMNGSFSRSTYAHELGHNLGLYHSHDLDCGAVTLGSSCSVREYGDTADLMGAGSGHFNAYQKDRLGWFGNSILTITQSGSYSLAPHEFASNKPLALKALKEIDSTSGAKTWYYIEYRQAIGQDSGLSFYSNGNLDKGLSVHLGTDLNGNKSYMLDMTPETAAWYDAALDTGKTFSDSSTDFSISTQWTGSDEAIADISVGPQVCTESNPVVSLSNPASWVEAGTPVSYTVTVTNRDNNECTDDTFSLAHTVPNGWSASFDQSSLTLAPGDSGSAVLTVTSSSSAADGFYDVRGTASKNAHSATDSSSYVIDTASSNSAPVAQNDSVTTTENTAVAISVLTNDTDPDGDTLSVTSVSGVNGSAIINGDGSITYTPPAGFSGTETFSYSVSDGKGASASATVTVSVSASSSNGAPVANDDSATTAENSAVTIAVLGNDYDPDGDSLQITSVSEAAKGRVTINSDGTITFTPGRNFKNTDTFSYTVSDGKLNTTANVSVSPTASGGDSSTGPGNGNGKNK